MSNQKRFSKIVLIVWLIAGLGLFSYLFSISKFNKEFNCVAMGNAYVGPGGYPKAPRDCQSFIEYVFSGKRDFPMY